MGGMFLKEFVEGPYPWAHIDIAATSKSKTVGSYLPQGATGFGVRLILDFIENYNGI
jgi:leucyl aminopeptidase